MEKYQITKTIRFKLEAVNQKAKDLRLTQVSTKKDLEQLIQSLEEIEHDFKKIFYRKDDSGKEVFDSIFKIKYSWMRTYLKNEFYNQHNGSKTKDYSLKDLRYVFEEIDQRWLEEWKDIIKKLKEYKDAKEESYFRKSQIGLTIERLSRRSNFEFIKEFSEAIVATQKNEIDDTITSFKHKLIVLGKLITEYQRNYLPSQTNGITVAGGSLNYYTINKTSKFETKLDEIQNILDKKINAFPLKKNGNEPFPLDKLLAKKIGLPDSLFEMSLDETYHFLKKWKSDKKNGIIHKAQDKENSLTINDILENGEFYLFNTSKENLNKCIELTKEIGKLGTDKDTGNKPEHAKKQIQSKITELKKERGDFFNTPDKKAQTRNYKDFCEFYKSIALRRGQELAKKRAIEKEQNTSKLLKYWCFVLEKDNSHYLYMIPRTEDDNLKKAKQHIDSLKTKNIEMGVRLFYFQSLTLSALRKLCFNIFDNTFKQETAKRDYPFFEQAMQEESEKVKFYQEILRIWKQKGNKDFGLDLTSFDLTELLTKSYKTMEEFEIALNKVCYVKQVFASNSIEKDLKEKFQAISFKITSSDIEHNLKYGTDNFKKKHHTDIWFEFWKKSNESQYPLRLNPEIKITWREAREHRVKKYINDPKRFDPKKKNRFAYEQFTLNTTFIQNAHHKKFDFAFTDHESIKKAIDEFNVNLEKENKGKWIYGIDRGEKELATLCVVKFINGENKKPEFAKLNLYKLIANKYYFKNEDKTDYSQVDKGFGGPIKNISYYLEKLNNNKWFEKVLDNESANFDLTTAKVIKGNIVLNGDLLTLLNLKILVAKRMIFEFFHSGKIDEQCVVKCRGKKKEDLSIYDIENNVIKPERVDDEGKNGIIIYRLTVEQKSNFEKMGQPIIDELNEYLNSLFEKSGTQYEPCIDKINHLRDSITANMIGVIKFLNQSYPLKNISLENLDEINVKNTGNKFIVDHFIKTKTSISRRLEWSIYRSLQDLSLVPPNIKETILLKDEFEQKQFGVIKFITTGGTSRNCPVCETEYQKTDEHYICKDTNCGFSSKDNRKGLDPLTNSDKVAAYNIAKRGLEILN